MRLSNKFKISLLIAFLGIILFNIKVFSVTGTITEITVNVRKEPSTSSKKLRYVTQDDKVEVLEKDGEWYKIKYKGTTGYVFGEYIKVDDTKLQANIETNIEEKTEANDKEKNSEVKEKTLEENEEINNKIQDITTDIQVKLVIKKKTDIRLIPNITSSIIFTTEKDTEVDIIEQFNAWAYVSANNIKGWVRTESIIEKSDTKTDNNEQDTDKETSEEKIAYIKYNTVNLRKKPSTSSTVLAKLKLNDEVIVMEKVNSTWSKVKVDGLEGYISTNLLSEKKQKEITNNANTSTTSRDGEITNREDTDTKVKDTTTSNLEEIKKEETIKNETEKKEDIVVDKEEVKEQTTSAKTKGEEIVEYAKKYLGYKYVYGGSSPSVGFDCSGLTYYVYKNFGYTLSRSSKAQATNGREVSKSNLQPGDLLIFKNQSLTAIGHVGIYIGNNKMIHSSEPGVGVVITDLNAGGYNYNKRYVTARRII